jgi:hypothetical protein
LDDDEQNENEKRASTDSVKPIKNNMATPAKLCEPRDGIRYDPANCERFDASGMNNLAHFCHIPTTDSRQNSWRVSQVLNFGLTKIAWVQTFQTSSVSRGKSRD